MSDEDKSPTAFEKHVAGLYRATGARVEHNKEIGGNQIDVWVEEDTPAGTVVRLVVECKDHARPVGIDHVNDLATKIDLLRAAGFADVGVLVSRSGFSTPARKAAERHAMRLVAVEDLEQTVQAPTRIVVDDVKYLLEMTRVLCSQFKETLRAPDRLTSFELDSLHADVTKLLREYEALQDRHRVALPSNNEARRALASVVRLEEATDQVLDALYYFRRVDEAIQEATGLVPAGRTEADFAAATSIRARDLEQARAQLRFRLRRLEETSERVAFG